MDSRDMQELSISVITFANIWIENLTKEEYSGNFRAQVPYISAHRDLLNPKMSLQLVKDRLAMIEHYRAIDTHRIVHWPHYALGRIGKHVYKYKFHYGFKAFVIYMAYREVQNYRHLRTVAYLDMNQTTYHYQSILLHALFAGAVCTFI